MTSSETLPPLALNLQDMSAYAEDAGSMLRALGNPHRLMILCLLTEGEASVGAIQEKLGIRQSLVSQHLTRLKADNLVTARRSQQFMLYSIGRPVVRDLIDVLCKHFHQNHD